MRPLLDPNDPFFAKPWRRWLTFIAPTAWGLFEFWMNDPFWAILFVGMGVYAGSVLIFNGPPDK